MSIRGDKKEWLPVAATNLDGMNQSEAENLLGLINHARDAMGSSTGQKPSKRWLDQGEMWISKVGADVFDKFIPELINEASRDYNDKNCSRHYHVDYYVENCSQCRHQREQLELIVGGSWLVSLSDSTAGVKAVASAFKPLSGRKNDLGNVTRRVLQSIASSDSSQSLEAIKQIKRLMAIYPKGNEGHQLRAAYAAIGKAKNLSIKELDAIAETDTEPDNYDDIIATFGAYSGKIVIEESGKVSLCWTGPNGRSLKNEPAEVKKSFERELKELKEKVKDTRTAMSWKSRRLESEMRSEISRTYGTWRKEFLGKPVSRSIVERLIWRIEGKKSAITFLVHGGGLMDIKGNNLGEIHDEWKITLWHPLDSNVDEVLQWRKRIENLEIVQPFKQAHREVYLLTEAERKAATYSSRFSSHILKGPQFLELCQARNWKCARWKDCATVEFDDLDVSASLRLDWEIGLNEGCPPYLTPKYVVTDQISFSKNDVRCPLEEIPPKIFSEIMRDVDLFVGVSSVANDPNWRDHYGNRVANDYWQSYAFGELSAPAETRRDLLERLLPNITNISSRCSLEDRFLVVRGDLRTYRIHLGSSNILMEPNNQYLCIVPRRNSKPQIEGKAIFLPFSGDITLSLILSKAFLLANDKDIKDTTIMDQILD